MYRVLVQLEEGELLHVASRNELEEAVQLIEGLNSYWPREYVVLDPEGNNIDFARYTALEAQRGSASPTC
jgi:hypothetical protein